MHPKEINSTTSKKSKLNSILETSNKVAFKKSKLRSFFSCFENQSPKWRIYRNLIVVSLSSLFYMSTLDGINSLQNSLNSAHLLGPIVHLTTSFTKVIFCLYLPLITLKLLGFKWSLIVAQSITISFIIANEFKLSGILIPSAVLHAIGSLIIYPLHTAFIAMLAKQFSNYTHENPVQTLVKFFAVSSSLNHFSKVFKMIFNNL